MFSILRIEFKFLAGLEALLSCQQIIPSQCVNIETSGEKRSRHSPLALQTGGRLFLSMIHWVTIALLMIPPNKIGDITAKLRGREVNISISFLLPLSLFLSTINYHLIEYIQTLIEGINKNSIGHLYVPFIYNINKMFLVK